MIAERLIIESLPPCKRKLAEAMMKKYFFQDCVTMAMIKERQKEKGN